jgi:mono/diheme cytochrome c family protein
MKPFMRKELTARTILATLILLVVALPFAGRWIYSHLSAGAIVVHARMPEDGGWSPDVLHAVAGQPLRLSLTSDDVLHGFAVGQMDIPAVDVRPGEVTSVTLQFSQPGTYAFDCTRWCGPNHWRMRGEIVVSGSSVQPMVAPAPPLWTTLGINLDAPHPAAVLPSRKPSARDGLWLAANTIAAAYRTPGYYRSHSPAQVWQDLRADLSLAGQSDAALWDVVAAIWQSNTSPQDLANGQKLYAANCAACHGETGAGDGVFAGALAAGGQSSLPGKSADQAMSMQKPTAFTDPSTMLGASPALLQGKILRGGMGTGMPMWGSIVTDQQSWDLVAYLFSFQFKEMIP